MLTTPPCVLLAHAEAVPGAITVLDSYTVLMAPPRASHVGATVTVGHQNGVRASRHAVDVVIWSSRIVPMHTPCPSPARWRSAC